MPVLGMFLGLEFFKVRHFARKTREITQNKKNQETFKKSKSNSRLLEIKIFCEGLF